MTLSKEHWIFIDNYIQTLDYAAAAREIGVPNKEAPTAGLNLLANKEIQEAIKLRRSELINAMQAIPMNKEQILATMMFQYQKANKLDRTKEATEILGKIAEANGIDLKQIQVEPINLIINNLDKDKI
ncbi:MAG: terminase small subunit [Cytophagales bacterium]|nr:terminase small subunit [Cytophagales bacterium]MBQ5917303.1 terminase small subunit [Lachnospiraceae bacterium]